MSITQNDAIGPTYYGLPPNDRLSALKDTWVCLPGGSIGSCIVSRCRVSGDSVTAHCRLPGDTLPVAIPGPRLCRQEDEPWVDRHPRCTPAPALSRILPGMQEPPPRERSGARRVGTRLAIRSLFFSNRNQPVQLRVLARGPTIRTLTHRRSRQIKAS